MSSDNVTGYGVPLTTAQRVRLYGPRTRPTLEGKTPDFELDESIEATHRETILLGYEDIDAKAKKTLSDARSWVWFQAIAAASIPFVWLLVATANATLGMAIVGSIIGVSVIFIGVGYRKLELRKHAGIVIEAHDYLRSYILSGKARLL